MESKSRLSRANPGLSIQEYVDKTIYDALEMFGSGEVPPCSRVARVLLSEQHTLDCMQATLKRLQTSIGHRVLLSCNIVIRAFLWIASTTDACRPVARPAPQCDSAAPSQWSDDFLMCS